MKKITTESGSIYKIDDHNICRKFDVDGNWIDSFKVFSIKPVLLNDDDIKTWKDLADLPSGDPQIGKRLYISGRDVWWISTPIVSIEDVEDEDSIKTL